MAALSNPIPASDLLVKRFTQVADDIIRRTSPQHNSFLASIEQDEQFTRALQGLKLLSKHYLPLVVDTLARWRKGTQTGMPEKPRDEREVMLNVCKLGAMEIVFFESALQLLDEFTPDFFQSKEFKAFYDNIHGLAFEWTLNGDELLIPNELAILRGMVVNTAARLLGAMSRINLAHVIDPFLKSLVERVNPKKEPGSKAINFDQLRAKIKSLCGGLKFVSLTFDTDDQLRAAVSFLRRAHPLSHTAPDKKSQVHHALCDMMTSILAPLIRSDQPHSCAHLSLGPLAEWYNTVLSLKGDIYNWMIKHPKHIPDGYPFFTTLVCLLDDESYSSGVDTTAEFLHRSMKAKENRSICVRCLVMLCCSYLARYGTAMPKLELHKWLDKTLKPVIAVAKKGGLTFQEQQEMIEPIQEMAPEFAVQYLICELLTSEVPDCIMAALLALNTLLTSPPGQQQQQQQAAIKRAASAAFTITSTVQSGSGGGALTSMFSTTSSTRRITVTSSTMRGGTRASQHQALELLRHASHPFEVLGITHQLNRVVAALSTLLKSWHSQYGSSPMWGPPDLNWKDKATGQAMFAQLLALLPYLRPEQWTAIRPLDLLPAYTMHMDKDIRDCARETVFATLRGNPHLRNAMITSFASFITSIPDDASNAQRDALNVLRQMMALWQGVLAERASGDVMEYSPGPDALLLDVHRLEGIAVSLLCSLDESVRREALQLLSRTRALHQALLAAEPYDLPPSPHRNMLRSGSSHSHASSQAGPAVMAGRHAHTASRDSFDIGAESRINNGLAEYVEPGLTYLIEVVEQAGAHIVAASYWDFGDWSDLWRQYKPVPEGVVFEDLLAARDDASRVRLCRALIELMATAAKLCPLSVTVAHYELLLRVARMLLRDANNKLIVSPEYMEGRRADVWRNCTAALCACPQSLRDKVLEKIGRRMPPVGMRDLIRLQLAMLQGTPITTQLTSMLSLGHLHPEYYSALLEEMQPYVEEYANRPATPASNKGSKSSKPRPDDIRKSVAHVYRILAGSAPPEVLQSHLTLRARLMEFLRDTYKYLLPLAYSSDLFWECSQVAYCFASIVNRVAVPLHNLLSQPTGTGKDSAMRASRGSDSSVDGSGAAHFRKQLWEQLRHWNEEHYLDLDSVKQAAAQSTSEPASKPPRMGELSGKFALHIKQGVEAALGRYKETDSLDGLRQELYQTAAYLNHISRLAMANLLAGPCFDSDVRNSQGRMLMWVDKLLAAPFDAVSTASFPGSGSAAFTVAQAHGPTRKEVARRALGALLAHNIELFGVYLDKCYDSTPSVATGYFQVLCEVYATQPVRMEQHVTLSLILYKMVDPAQEVREDAFHMLHVLKHREWHNHPAGCLPAGAAGGDASPGAPTVTPSSAHGTPTRSDVGGVGASTTSIIPENPTMVVLGGLQDTYLQDQLEQSGQLAREHPELSEALCEEMMTRQLACADALVQQPLLHSLTPWMENLSISPHWKGNWCERLLKSMYWVTLRLGSQMPWQTEMLWCTLARNKRNIIPILDFLISFGMDTALQELDPMQEFLGVGKRIALFLAHASPQQTIDHLVFELSKQLEEEEGEAPPAQPQPQSQGLLSGGVTGDVPVTFAMLADAAGQAPAADPGVSTSYDSGRNALLGASTMGMMGAVAGELSSARTTRSLDLANQQGVFGGVAATDSVSSKDSLAANSVGLADGQQATTQPPPLVTASGNRLSGWAAASQAAPAPTASRSQPVLRHQSTTGSQTPRARGALMSRPELALCLLSEVVYDLDADFLQYLPLLLHCALVLQDHDEVVVAAHCQQLLINLLASMSAYYSRQAGAADQTSSDAAALIRYLQSMRGRRLWQWEEAGLATGLDAPLPSTSTMAGLAGAVLEALMFEPGLSVSWADTALQWALHCRSRHLSCRSFQLLRSLRPPLSADLAATLIMCAQACFAAASVKGREVAVEVVTTIKALVAVLPPGRLVVYPQVWWTSLALLHTPHVHMYLHALSFVSTTLSGLQLHQGKVQAVLLASAPGAQAAHLMGAHLVASSAAEATAEEDPEPWALGYQTLGMEGAGPQYSSLAVQQLLLKGLLFSETAEAALRVLGQLAGMLVMQAEAMVGRHGGALGRSASNDKASDQDQSSRDPTAASPVTRQHFDSMRKHRALKLDSFQTLLGSCRSQLFVSLMGLLPLLLASAPAACSPDGLAPPSATISLASPPSCASAPAAVAQSPSSSAPSPVAAATPFGGSAAVANIAAGLPPGGTVGSSSTVGQAAMHRPGCAPGPGLRGSSALVAALVGAAEVVGRAAQALGLADIAAPLAELCSPVVVHDAELLDMQLGQLCGGIARALFPRYSRAFLHHCLDLVSGPSCAGGRMTRTGLLLLRAMFRYEGLQLGGGAASLLLDGSTLAPVAGLVQSVHSDAALAALAAVLRYTQQSRFAAEVGRATTPSTLAAQQAMGLGVGGTAAAGGVAANGSSKAGGPDAMYGGGLDKDRKSSAAGAADTSTGSAAGLHPPPSSAGSFTSMGVSGSAGGLRTLQPPPVAVWLKLQHVVETLGSGMKRRKPQKLMPYLGSLMHTANAH